MAQEFEDHDRFGVTEKRCGECGGSTFLAKTFERSPTTPSIVQARCRRLECTWKGQLIRVPF